MPNWTSLMNSLNAAALSAFGREVQYVCQSGERVVIRAVFESAHQAEDAAPGIYAIVFVRPIDLPVAAQRGDRVVIDDGVYSVFQIEADGQGGATLSLRKE
jgi:hypothetical protein